MPYLGRVFLQLKDGKGIDDFMVIKGPAHDEFFAVGEQIKKVLKDLFQPDKINYAALSNVSPTIHVHIIPRYKTPRSFAGVTFTDARWGSNYAPYDRSFVIDEQVLYTIRDAISKQLT